MADRAWSPKVADGLGLAMMGDHWRKKFWALTMPEPNTGCWLWTGALFNHRYGKWVIGGKFKLAHRIAYELAYAPIPSGWLVCHRCDNPPCVNPAHLFLGTYKDNAQDASRKHRYPSRQGHRNPRAKLNDIMATEIRQLADVGVYRHALATRYGVGTTAIADVVCGRKWNG